MNVCHAQVAVLTISTNVLQVRSRADLYARFVVLAQFVSEYSYTIATDNLLP